MFFKALRKLGQTAGAIVTISISNPVQAGILFVNYLIFRASTLPFCHFFFACPASCHPSTRPNSLFLNQTLTMQACELLNVLVLYPISELLKNFVIPRIFDIFWVVSRHGFQLQTGNGVMPYKYCSVSCGQHSIPLFAISYVRSLRNACKKAAILDTFHFPDFLSENTHQLS